MAVGLDCPGDGWTAPSFAARPALKHSLSADGRTDLRRRIGFPDVSSASAIGPHDLFELDASLTNRHNDQLLSISTPAGEYRRRSTFQRNPIQAS